MWKCIYHALFVNARSNILLFYQYFLNKTNELTFRLFMLVQIYFGHAELWHSKPVIRV